MSEFKLIKSKSGNVINVKGYKKGFGFTGNILKTALYESDVEGQKLVADLGFEKVSKAIAYPDEQTVDVYKKKLKAQEVTELYYLDLKFIFHDDEEANLDLFNHEGKTYLRVSGKKKLEPQIASLSKPIKQKILIDERRADLGFAETKVIDPADFSKLVKGVVGYKTLYDPKVYKLDNNEFGENESKYIIGEERLVLMLEEFDTAVYEQLKPNLIIEEIK